MSSSSSLIIIPPTCMIYVCLLTANLGLPACDLEDVGQSSQVDRASEWRLAYPPERPCSKVAGTDMDASTRPADLIYRFLNSPHAAEKTKRRLRQSLEIVAKAHEQFDANELAMSFNGGKDCLVMLYVILATTRKPLKSVYVRVQNSFSEVDEFVKESVEKYNLDISIYTLPMQEALKDFLERNSHIKAVFVGIRRADPWADSLQYIQATDHGWPDFIRVHPILEWEYDDIWNFLRTLDIPYCPLYDLGYTSLGSTDTTVRNPSLKIEGSDAYRPAYELQNFSLERVGRTKRSTGNENT